MLNIFLLKVLGISIQRHEITVENGKKKYVMGDNIPLITFLLLFSTQFCTLADTKNLKDTFK